MDRLPRDKSRKKSSRSKTSRARERWRGEGAQDLYRRGPASWELQRGLPWSRAAVTLVVVELWAATEECGDAKTALITAVGESSRRCCASTRSVRV
jgi:hypothetical protein